MAADNQRKKIKTLRLEDSHLLRTFKDALTPLPEERWEVGSCAEDEALPKVLSRMQNLMPGVSKIVFNCAMQLGTEADQVTMMESCLNCDQKLLILSSFSENVMYYDVMHFVPAFGDLHHML